MTEMRGGAGGLGSGDVDEVDRFFQNGLFRYVQDQTILEIEGVEGEERMIRLVCQIFLEKRRSGRSLGQIFPDRGTAAGIERVQPGEFWNKPAVDKDQPDRLLGVQESVLQEGSHSLNKPGVWFWGKRMKRQLQEPCPQRITPGLFFGMREPTGSELFHCEAAVGMQVEGRIGQHLFRGGKKTFRRFGGSLGCGSCISSDNWIHCTELSGWGLHFFGDPVVATLFQFEGEMAIATADNPAVHEHMNPVRDDIIQETLIVSDDQLGTVRPP